MKARTVRAWVLVLAAAAVLATTVSCSAGADNARPQDATPTCAAPLGAVGSPKRLQPTCASSPEHHTGPAAGRPDAGNGPVSQQSRSDGRLLIGGFLLFGFGLAVGFAGTVVALRRGRATGGAYGPTTARPGAAAANSGSGERETLIRQLIDVRDRLSNPALIQRIDHGLTTVGVTTISPAAGSRTNAQQHQVAGTVTTSDPALDWCIAEVVAIGHSDRSAVVRPAEVIIYRRPS
jgi:hypothetical protein